MDYFVSNISYCHNKTIGSYIYNITSPYTDSTNRASIVGTSVAMFTLTTLFFNLNFFSRVSHASSILNPSVGLIRSAALSLFLPVMSYLFSDAKRSEAGGSGIVEPSAPELSLRARLILTWMLLVELLRHRAEAILASTGAKGYTANVEHAARIVWLGNLVFFSIQSPGRRALFGVLWVIAAAKLVRRVVIAEFIKRSFAFGRNPDILTAYMVQVLKEQPDFRRDGEHPNPSNSGERQAEILTSCKLAVTGEEKLEKTTSPNGYRVKMEKKRVAVDNPVVTVGQIWTLAEGNELLKSSPRLKMLPLSFALFKLLRRRLEDPLAISTPETRSCRDVIFNGLHSQGANNPADTAVGLFEMVNKELNFLSEYYHSVLPVVLASPFFFLVNYILFPIMVCCLCAMTIVLCGNGDVPVTLYSLKTDNYVTSSGAATMTICLMRKALTSLPALLSAIDLSITLFLFLIYIYEEVWELIVFLLSDWFLVSLLCDYTARPDRRMVPIFRCAISCILWVRNRVPPFTLKLKQLDLLSPWPCQLSLILPEVPVPKEAKRSIAQYLSLAACGAGHGGAESTLSNGKSALNATQHSHLSWACESESVTEVILTWHIATRLFEASYPQKKGAVVTLGRKTATSLSRYCAYLVASHPELLPDDRNDTEHVYKVVNEELKQTLGFSCYYCCRESRQCKELLSTAGNHAEEEAMTLTVAKKGVRLGKSLVDEAARDGEGAVWQVLADLWVELIVYVAPASGEVHVNGHRAALVHGGEFVTLLWALATHTGITRPVIRPGEEIFTRQIEID